MAKFIRHGIAAVFFAASVGCLALWVVGLRHPQILYKAERISPSLQLFLEANNGRGIIATATGTAADEVRWRFVSYQFPGALERPFLAEYGEGHFGYVGDESIYFPLWYPALVFALAGAGVLRFRRQFSIRSAMICLTVVAALLGMVVAL